MPNKTSEKESDGINQTDLRLTKKTENAPIFIPAHATRKEEIKSSGVKVDAQANMWVSAKEWHEAARAFVQETALYAQIF